MNSINDPASHSHRTAVTNAESPSLGRAYWRRSALPLWLRFFAWISSAAVVTVFAAPASLTLLSQEVNSNFGAVFPAIPLVALLLVVMTLRLGEFMEILAKEGGLRSELPTRLLGLVVIVIILIARPLTNQTVEFSGVAVILSVYATSLVINPLTRRIMLPYAAICAVGAGAPTLLQSAFGAPLATFTSDLSARLAAVAGFPVTWQGTQFQLLSKSGDVITGTVTSDCSGIVSVTAFLGLLALMHIDTKKNIRSTTEIAIAGVAILILVNALRIVLLLWVGYVDGATVFWSTHDWIGYVLFLGVYLSVLAVYSRVGQYRPSVPTMTLPPTPARMFTGMARAGNREAANPSLLVRD